MPLTLEFSGALVAPAPRAARARRPAPSSSSRSPKAAGFAPGSAGPHRSLRYRQPRRRACRGGWSRHAPSSCRPSACGPQPAHSRPAVHLAQRARCLALGARRGAPGWNAAPRRSSSARLARRDGTHSWRRSGRLVSKRHALPERETGGQAASADPGRLGRPARTRRHRTRNLASRRDKLRVRVEGLETPVDGASDRIARRRARHARHRRHRRRAQPRGEAARRPVRRGHPGAADATPASRRRWPPRGPDRQAQVWAIEGGALARRSGDAGPAQRQTLRDRLGRRAQVLAPSTT